MLVLSILFTSFIGGKKKIIIISAYSIVLKYKKIYNLLFFAFLDSDLQKNIVSSHPNCYKKNHSILICMGLGNPALTFPKFSSKAFLHSFHGGWGLGQGSSFFPHFCRVREGGVSGWLKVVIYIFLLPEAWERLGVLLYLLVWGLVPSDCLLFFRRFFYR